MNKFLDTDLGMVFWSLAFLIFATWCITTGGPLWYIIFHSICAFLQTVYIVYFLRRWVKNRGR